MYDKKLKEFKERQAKLITEKQLHSDGDQEFYLSVNMVLNVASRAAEIIKSSEPEEKEVFHLPTSELHREWRNTKFFIERTLQQDTRNC